MASSFSTKSSNRSDRSRPRPLARSAETRAAYPGAPSAARRRVLSQWRGVDLEPLESARRDTAKSIASLVPRVVADLGLEARRADAEIVRVWNDLLDPTLTAHAQPVNLARGTLFVSVSTSVWLDTIVRYHRREILDRLQHAFGREVVKKISYRIG